ncbi:MAG: hypothetical protein Q8P41_09820 [Pseudomonadota bacterium]|nr:hypothetical protein [Pseudomonadota bacterium]
MEAPKPYIDSGALTILSGILNILTGGAICLSLLIVCVGVLWVVPMAIGVFQVVVGIAMNKGQRHGSAGYIGILGLVAGILNFNPLAIGAAVLTMINVKKPEVAGYLEGA